MHVPVVTGNRKRTLALSMALYGSHYSKVGLVVFGLGVVFHVTGYSVPDWERVDTATATIRKGLWKWCSEGQCTTLSSEEDWLFTVRILESVALFLEVAAGVVVACYMFRGTRTTAFVSAFLCISSGMTTLTGAVVYWSKHNKDADLYWGFAFEVIGALNCLAAGGLFVYEGKTRTGYVVLR